MMDETKYVTPIYLSLNITRKIMEPHKRLFLKLPKDVRSNFQTGKILNCAQMDAEHASVEHF